jgi:hypothetical protein
MDGHAAFALKQKPGFEAKLESFRRREPLAALGACELIRVDAADFISRNRSIRPLGENVERRPDCFEIDFRFPGIDAPTGSSCN